MAASLLLACGLNEQGLDSYIHISEDFGVDGSFLISSILGQRLRTSNSGVVLVCLQHTFQHYLNAGMRLGYNLNMFKDKNLSVIEPISNIGTNVLNSPWVRQDKVIAEVLREEIKTKLTQNLTNNSKVTVIIDDLSILFNLGSNKEDVLKLLKELRSETQTNSQVTVISKLGNSDVFDIIDNNLTTISDLHIQVIKLKSGNFKEVDGKLIVNKIILESDYDIKTFEKHILYKVNERNIKFFNPGEVGVSV